MSYQAAPSEAVPAQVYPAVPAYPVQSYPLPEPYWTHSPQPVTCPHCHATMTSTVHYEAGTATWLSCVGICALGGGMGCCLIPFCVKPFKDCLHYCANCETFLYRKNVI